MEKLVVTDIPRISISTIVDLGYTQPLVCKAVCKTRNLGFTLVELLVVVAIIAVMSTLVIVNLTGTDIKSVVITETRRLARLLELANDMAIRNNFQIGVSFKNSGYHFLIFNQNKNTWEEWMPVPFKARTFPEGISVIMQVENQTLNSTLSQSRNTANDKKNIPDILLLSSGEYTPFKLYFIINNRNSDWYIAGDGFGRIRSKSSSDREDRQ